MVLHDEWRDGAVVELVEIADGLPPALLAGGEVVTPDSLIGNAADE
jgi:hypothetical protein